MQNDDIYSIFNYESLFENYNKFDTFKSFSFIHSDYSSRLIYEEYQLECYHQHSPTVLNEIEGDYVFSRRTENEMNANENKILSKYQKSSPKEENKGFFSTLPASKEMNEGINNMLSSNPEIVKKSVKENKKKKKKKCKYKIWKILVIGRKRKHYINGDYNKFAYDNMTRKLKAHLFESIRILLNASLREVDVENPEQNSMEIIFKGPFFVKISQKL